MLRRRKPYVVLLSAEEVALLETRAAALALDIDELAQVVFRAGLGAPDPDDPDLAHAPAATDRT